MTVIDTVLLKVASRCNLNCTYCYVFNMGDERWRTQPKRLSVETLGKIVEQLKALYDHQRRPFSIVLHGGEPLLLGPNRLEAVLSAIRVNVPDCGLHLQTNGTLLDREMVDIIGRHRVNVPISLDGPEQTTDAFRVDHQANGSFSRVMAGIAELRGHKEGESLFSGLLAVIDPRTDPGSVYSFFKQVRAPSVDFLYRDGNHDALPFGKASLNTREYGEWMAALLDFYLLDRNPPRIRVLDDLIKLTLGGFARKEGVGVSDFGIVVIDTDGTIAKNDTLKSASVGADAFLQKWSVHKDRLVDVVATTEFRTYHESQRPTSKLCATCPELPVCGGGMSAHRWSGERGFDNPSVFCADQKILIARVRNWISAREIKATPMNGLAQ